MTTIRMESPMVRMDTILELKEAAEGMQLAVVMVHSKSKTIPWRIHLVVSSDLTSKREFKPHPRKKLHQA